jgi:hypothetical protein
MTGMDARHRPWALTIGLDDRWLLRRSEHGSWTLKIHPSMPCHSIAPVTARAAVDIKTLYRIAVA